MPTMGAPGDGDVDAVLAAYGGWLKRQPLSVRSREAYLAQVRDFVGWLAGSEHGGQALADPHVRDWAVRGLQALREDDEAVGAGVGEPGAGGDRQLLPLARRGAARCCAGGARADSARGARRGRAAHVPALRAGGPVARDRAIATAFFYAGLRLSELGALDITDISLSPAAAASRPDREGRRLLTWVFGSVIACAEHVARAERGVEVPYGRSARGGCGRPSRDEPRTSSPRLARG